MLVDDWSLSLGLPRKSTKNRILMILYENILKWRNTKETKEKPEIFNYAIKNLQHKINSVYIKKSLSDPKAIQPE